MQAQFYLSSQDWGEPWEPRKCKYLATYRAIPTGQVLFQLKVFPPLPKELSRSENDVSQILIGTINQEWSLKDLGKIGFCVDIYIPKINPNSGFINVKNLIRIGVGILHKTLHEAEMK